MSADPGPGRRLLEGIASNLLAVIPSAIVLAGAGAFLVWLQNHSGDHVPAWSLGAVALIALVLAMALVVLWILYRRQRRKSDPRRRLVGRIDTLDGVLRQGESSNPVEWELAGEFNELLNDARSELGTDDLSAFAEADQATTVSSTSHTGPVYAKETYGLLRARLGRIRALARM
jgi:hypothetical protein